MKRLRKATPFVVSLTLHLALIVGISIQWQHPVAEQLESFLEHPFGESTQPPSNPEVIEKIEVEMIETKKEEEGDLPLKAEPEKPVLTECEGDNWYGGIGIQQDWQTGQIEAVYRGYPADKGGLRVGDMIQFVDGTREDRIRGEPGTTVTISIFRPSTNEYLTFTIQRDRICIGARI